MSARDGAQERINQLAAMGLGDIAAREQERVAAYRAQRERQDTILLDAQRSKVQVALTIPDTRQRDRELGRVAGFLRDHVWALELSDVAHRLARDIEEVLRYGGRDALADLARATRPAAISQEVA